MKSKIQTYREEVLKGCGKELKVKDDYSDYTCGDDFLDDDGNPWVAYCEECNSELKAIDKMIELFKEEIEEWIKKNKAYTLSRYNCNELRRKLPEVTK